MLQMLKGGSHAKCDPKKKSTKSNFLYDEKDMIKVLTDAGYYDEFKQLKAKVDNKYSATHIIVAEDNDDVITGISMMPRSEYNRLAHASKDWEDSNVVIYDKTKVNASAKSTASVAFVDYAKLRYSISISEGKFSTIAFENGEKVVCSNNILFLGISDHLKLDINNQMSEGEIKQLIEKSEPVMVNADSKSYDLGGGNTLESVGFDTNGNWCYWVKLPKLRQRAIKVQIEANWAKISKSDLRNGVIEEKGLSELREYLTTHYKAKFDTVVACDEDEDCSADSIIAELQGN